MVSTTHFNVTVKAVVEILLQVTTPVFSFTEAYADVVSDHLIDLKLLAFGLFGINVNWREPASLNVLSPAICMLLIVRWTYEINNELFCESISPKRSISCFFNSNVIYSLAASVMLPVIFKLSIVSSHFNKSIVAFFQSTSFTVSACNILDGSVSLCFASYNSAIV